ncbi:hypothetical protein ACPCAE_30995 [Streptomyces cinereoruber]|uniref:hypothetical protein n=1 Tax=Streptomyces cinereoruber TaxID=67260 RepID=UPI003625504C
MRTREHRPHADKLGTGVSVVVIALGVLVTGYFVLIAYMVDPDGPWDRQAVTSSHIAAGIGLVFAAFLALVTWIVAKAGWLRKGWHVLPAALAFAALLRLTLLAPEL